MVSKFIEIDHPGAMLKEDFLDDLDIKPGTLASAIGVDRTAVKNIIEGNRAISADMALRLGLFFNMSAGFWLNLQKDYEFRIAERENLDKFRKVVQPLDHARA